MLSKKVENSLNKQIELEANASQFYLAMASWAETKDLKAWQVFSTDTPMKKENTCLNLSSTSTKEGDMQLFPRYQNHQKSLIV